MSHATIHKTINYIIAIVWFINGFLCKVLNLAPRHQLIVSRILGDDYAIIFTKTIGVLEILMAVWILSRIQSKLNAIIQIIVIITMNIIEFILAPDLLLFSKMNLVFALLFSFIIYWNEFILSKKV